MFCGGNRTPPSITALPNTWMAPYTVYFVICSLFYNCSYRDYDCGRDIGGNGDEYCDGDHDHDDDRDGNHFIICCLWPVLIVIMMVEHSSSAVESRTRNRESPGLNPLCYCFGAWAFSFSPQGLSPISCITEYPVTDSRGNVSELVFMHNCSVVTILPREVMLVPEWTGPPEGDV